ncbi:MAG: peptide chain release factor N(5)-glutamine methyltransferase [Chlamydiales bacterium]|nr:peptide chain release factor N(5)-glutamine methyltransferase [Chlamydiales bacterium]
MMTLLDVIRRSEAFLKERGIERPRREAEEVIADALGVRRIDLYLRFEHPFTQEELAKLREPVLRRAAREPAAYIARRVSFCDLSIRVTPDVLIPRPETEILVEKIAETLKNRTIEGKTLWDMCCGSGCIGHALKRKFPSLNVVLSDLSEKALAVARQNGEGVVFKQGDLFAPFEGEKCDFFVCNPPYVTEEEYADLAPEVKAEPKMALVGGLSFYKRIADRLFDFLNPRGIAWLEIGSGQGEDIKKIFNGRGRIENDWAGHTRFFFLERD